MILLCYDGSDASKRVVAIAHQLLGNAPTTVLHLWDPPASFLLPEPIAYTGMAPMDADQIGKLDAIMRERSNRVLDEGVTLARNAGLDAVGRLETSRGSAWRTILEVADDIDAALIVLGDHGLGVIESALLGNTSSEVIHHAHRPVLVVPAVSE